MSRRTAAAFAAFAVAAMVIVGVAMGGPINTPPEITVTYLGLDPVEGNTSGGATITYGVTATDFEDGTPSVSCTQESGSVFPLGGNSVTCTATDSGGLQAQGGFSVTVQDTTDPVFGSPSGTEVTDTTPPSGQQPVAYSITATDIVDASAAVSCTPTSGSSFNVGNTTVNCTATDDSGNDASTSFTVTVNPAPNTPPTVTVNGPSEVAATSPAGAVVDYTVTVSDTEDNPDPVASCPGAPASGTTFPVGTTSFTCTATDSGGLPGSDDYQVTVTPYVDDVPPVFGAPSGTNAVDSTPPNGSEPVNYSISATDNVDTDVAISCTPEPGSSFSVGSSGVSCTATDDSGNSAQTSFQVFVQDVDAPVVTTPSNMTVEANGPNGSVVSYSPATATDTGGPVTQVQCTPPPGSTFPLGTTQVNCAAGDSQGNLGSASFTITVLDTTPPVLTIPADLAIQSTTDLPATDPRIKEFLEAATATDIVDGDPEITTNAPGTFPVGDTIVVFTAEDESGNTTEKSAVLTVTANATGPQPGGDTTPPANVTNVRAIIGNLSVALSWRLPPADADRVKVFQSSTGARSGLGQGDGETLIYEGKKTSLVVRGLTKDVQYRFVIVAYDKAGNRAAGVAVVALAQEQTLLAPANGAFLTSAPLIRWKPVRNARYYNVQVWFEPRSGRTPVAALSLRKVMSAWPAKASFKMKKTWRFGGKRYTLKPGRYVLYVFPGIGPKSAGKYGKVHVLAEFTITRG